MGSAVSYAERKVAWESLVKLSPDQADAWHELGEIYFHYGGLIGLTDNFRRAHAPFAHALALDSTFATALTHLVDIAAIRNDTAEARLLGSLPSTRDSAGRVMPALGWKLAQILGDSATVRSMRGRMESLPDQALENINFLAGMTGIGMEDAPRALMILLDRAKTTESRRAVLHDLHGVALMRGRPGEALRWLEVLRESETSPYRNLYTRVSDGLVGEGDSVAAARAVPALARLLERRPLDGARPQEHIESLCVLEQWRLRNGEAGSARRTIAQLRTWANSAPENVGGVSPRVASAGCVLLLEALMASLGGGGEVESRLSRLDAWLTDGPPAGAVREHANLTSAWLHRRYGDLAAALRAARRQNFAGYAYHTTFWREEGSLASMTADRRGAIRAYEWYLAYRSHPEPALAPEVARVRAELSKLTRQR